MKQSLLDVFVALYEDYLANDLSLPTELRNVMAHVDHISSESLFEESSNETPPTLDSVVFKKPSHESIRYYDNEEQAIFTPESMRLLLHLENVGAITQEEREIIIAEAIESGLEQLSANQLRLLILLRIVRLGVSKNADYLLSHLIESAPKGVRVH